MTQLWAPEGSQSDPSYNLRSLIVFTSLPLLLAQRNHQISHFSVCGAQIVNAIHDKMKQVVQNGAEASAPKVFSVPRETLKSGSV